MLASSAELSALYDRLNVQFFGGELPLCTLVWSRRLTRAAGNIRVESRLITLSVPLLHEMWGENTAFEVCGVRCTCARQALLEILKHEMIHLWLHEKRLPCGHTREFRQKAKALGQPKTRHGIARPTPQTGWIYECAACGSALYKRKRFGRRVTCAACCKKSGNGQYDERFRLRGRQLKKAEEAEGITR